MRKSGGLMKDDKNGHKVSMSRRRIQGMRGGEL